LEDHATVSVLGPSSQVNGIVMEQRLFVNGLLRGDSHQRLPEADLTGLGEENIWDFGLMNQ
jgi:hypothetical protein